MSNSTKNCTTVYIIQVSKSIMILLCDTTHSALMKVYNYTAKKYH